MAEERGKRRKIVASKTDGNEDFCLAKECIKLHLITTPDEYQTGGRTFSPEFLEEHFGETGIIYGYQGLKVDIWFHSSSFYVFVDIKYDAVVQVGRKKVQKPLDAIFKEIFGSALVENHGTFLKQIDSYNTQFSDLLKKHAEKLSTLEAAKNSSSSALTEIFRLELTVPEVRDWHRRLNPLVLWFVEGASCIEVEDPRWEVYVAVETEQDRHNVVGVCNVYRFFHYPDSTRLRISQILVIPYYQKQQYGYHLLNAVNNVAVQRNCFDVTMEDPSDRLQKLRDCMDVLRLLEYPPLYPKLDQAVGSISKNIMNKALLLPPPDLASGIREQFKISKAQCKKCWEVMLYLHLDAADDSALKTLRELIAKKTFAEMIEDKENKLPCPSHCKRVIDTENDYDSDKTFVMLKCRGNGKAGQAAETSQVDEAARAEAFKDFLRERDENIMEVGRKVASLCKVRSIPVKFNLQAWL